MQSLSNGLRMVIGKSWPIIMILSFIFVIIHILWLTQQKKKISIFMEIVVWCFIIYMLSLFHIVTSQDVYNSGGVNMTFFKEITRYPVGTNLFYRNIIGNIFLFLPLGFFIGYFIKVKRHYLVILFIMIMSLVIESVQLYIGRSFDVDDVILNVLGGIIGYILSRIMNFLLRNLKPETQNIIISIILLLSIFSIFIIMLQGV